MPCAIPSSGCHDLCFASSKLNWPVIMTVGDRKGTRRGGEANACVKSATVCDSHAAWITARWGWWLAGKSRLLSKFKYGWNYCRIFCLQRRPTSLLSSSKTSHLFLGYGCLVASQRPVCLDLWQCRSSIFSDRVLYRVAFQIYSVSERWARRSIREPTYILFFLACRLSKMTKGKRPQLVVWDVYIYTTSPPFRT